MATSVYAPASSVVRFTHEPCSPPGTPREWLYNWYSPLQSKDMTVREYAFDQRFKLYRTGQFYYLNADEMEKQDLAATARCPRPVPKRPPRCPRPTVPQLWCRHGQAREERQKEEQEEGGVR